jgi:hypothetical protein
MIKLNFNERDLAERWGVTESKGIIKGARLWESKGPGSIILGSNGNY